MKARWTSEKGAISIIRALKEKIEQKRGEADRAQKGSYLLDAYRRRNADGVIFAAPSFCDPALLDQPMMISRLEALGIPYITMQYAENSGQMQPIREQSGTFADSIKLWGAS